MTGIYYQEKGNGFPILLLHGFCETHEIWKLVVDPLASEFRVIAIDLPGFGKSTPLPSPHSIDDVADQILEFIIRDLGISSCIVLGHSLGGYVALAMVAKHAALFKAFGLVHSTAYADSEDRKESRNKVVEFVKSHGVAPFIQAFIPPLFYDQNNPHLEWAVKLASYTPLETLVSYTEAMRDRPDRAEVLKNYLNPVLLLAGQKDSIVPEEIVRQQSAILKSPSFRLLSHVGHMGMLENEEDTLQVIRGFLHKVI